ncbi:hypothetical protein AAV98_12320 [Bacillus sp. CHD6a]|nr:hypothetical protein AAV98_12320 [Bacillus sp. CHD6a]
MLQSTARNHKVHGNISFSAASLQAEEAHGPPAGKRSAWNGNQHLPTISLLIKMPPVRIEGR